MRLVLIKHSLPEIVASLPAARWQLSVEGRQRCAKLAQHVAEYAPQVVVSSTEPKASETGQLLAEQLAIPSFTAPGLHEHERPATDWMTQEAFEASVAALFTRPHEVVFGAESAFQALERFRIALGAALARFPDQNLAVVSHGTVISLFVAAKNNDLPFPLWKRLGLPSVMVLSLPGYTLEKVIEYAG